MFAIHIVGVVSRNEIEMSTEPGRYFTKLMHDFLFTLVMVVTVVIVSNDELITVMGCVRMRLRINYKDWVLLFVMVMVILTMLFMVTV